MRVFAGKWRVLVWGRFGSWELIFICMLAIKGIIASFYNAVNFVGEILSEFWFFGFICLFGLPDFQECLRFAGFCGWLRFASIGH
jgi:hypothetical protein